LPQDVTPAIAKAFNVTDTTGALVGDITPEGPASRSDLKKGDIILSLNGQLIANANQLRLRIGELAPDASVKLKVLRDGKTHEVTVKLSEFPAKEERASANKESSDSALEGVDVENVTPEMARELKLPSATKGVVVKE